MNLDSLYPQPLNWLINGKKLLPKELQGKDFLTWRSRGKRDATRKDIPVGIGRKGIDLDGRYLFTDQQIVKSFQGFPPSFLFSGTPTQQLKQIGNAVSPP
jgi:hypothetical protein